MKNMGNSPSSSSSSSNGVDDRNLILRLYDRNAAASARCNDKSDFTTPEDLIFHLKPGDILQTKGRFLYQWFYSHFAVYIGNGDIVHVAGGEIYKGEVKREDMLDAFCGNDVRKNNHMDGTFQPQRVQDIVRTARDFVGKEWSYNFLTNNCEHFASMCRYGKRISLQSLSISDIKNGDLTAQEYMYYHYKSAREKCSTFLSWVQRKVVYLSGAILEPLLAISYDD